MSETATARPHLATFCVGNGIDIGAGGDPIVPTAICIDRDESADNRAHVGSHPTHLVGDAADLKWFKDGVLDYAYSSHTLEDFEDTCAILTEWLRVLRPGGLMVLFLPDQEAYEKFCESNGSLPNQAHKHKDFSLSYVTDCLKKIGVDSSNVIESVWPFPGNPYSFSLVLKKP